MLVSNQDGERVSTVRPVMLAYLMAYDLLVAGIERPIYDLNARQRLRDASKTCGSLFNRLDVRERDALYAVHDARRIA